MKKMIITAALVNTFVFLLISNVRANPVESITNWLSNEKTKIVEYQTKSWADSKAQLTNTKQSILNLFKGSKDGTQN